MKRKFYQFAYSKDWEGTKRFYKRSRLIAWLQKIPDWELKYTNTLYWDGKFYRMGAYYVTKKGKLQIKF